MKHVLMSDMYTLDRPQLSIVKITAMLSSTPFQCIESNLYKILARAELVVLSPGSDMESLFSVTDALIVRFL